MQRHDACFMFPKQRIEAAVHKYSLSSQAVINVYFTSLVPSQQLRKSTKLQAYVTEACVEACMWGVLALHQ